MKRRQVKLLLKRQVNQQKNNNFLLFSYFNMNFLEEFNLGAMRLQTALVHDGVILLAETFKQLGLEQIQPINLYCIGNDSMWEKGMSISNFMRNVSFNEIFLKSILK